MTVYIKDDKLITTFGYYSTITQNAHVQVEVALAEIIDCLRNNNYTVEPKEIKPQQ